MASIFDTYREPNPSVTDEEEQAGFLSTLYNKLAMPLIGGVVGPAVDNFSNPNRSPIQKATHFAGDVANIVAPVTAALTSYSPEAEAAIFPKGAQIGSSSRSNLMSLFKDDPIKAKYVSNQFGRTDDPYWEYLSREGTEKEKKDYLLDIVERMTPGMNATGPESRLLSKQLASDKHIRLANPTIRTWQGRRNNLADESEIVESLPSTEKEKWIAHNRFTRSDEKLRAEKLFRETASSDDLLSAFRDRYKDVKTLGYTAPNLKHLNENDTALKEIGKNPTGMSIADRFKFGIPAMKKRYSAEVTPYHSVTDESGNSIADIVQLKTYKSLKNEGDYMEHSVGGYSNNDGYGLGGGMEAIKSGDVKIYSARDPKTGKPNLTFEVDGKTGDIVQIKGPQNSTEWTPEQIKAIDSFMEKTGYSVADHPIYTGWDKATDYFPNELKEKYSSKMKPLGKKKLTEDEDPYYYEHDGNPEEWGLQQEAGAHNGQNDNFYAQQEARVDNIELRAVEGGLGEISENEGAQLLHRFANLGDAHITPDQRELRNELQQYYLAEARRDGDFLTYGGREDLQRLDNGTLSLEGLLNLFFTRNDIPF
jgi:hypothetical protein